MGVTIAELTVADDPAAWRGVGFAVNDDVCLVEPLSVRLVGRDAGKGVVGWTLTGVPSGCDDLDGIPTTGADAATDPPQAPLHPNGVTGIDHVVLMTPDLVRTTGALAAIGLDPRRTRDAEMGGQPVRQVFYRLGAVIVEVVGTPDAAGDGPSRIWGITHTVADLDATAEFLGGRVGRVKDAVQPGRRITTLRHHDAGLSVATAFISVGPSRG